MRRAFTLLEVMIVVALLGLLAGATAWSLAADARRGTRRGVLDRLVHADRMARLASRRLGRPCVVRFDLERWRVERIEDRPDGPPRATHAWTLPKGVRLDRIATAADAGAATRPAPGRRKAEPTVVDIPYSTAGRSPTYAVRLVGGEEAEATWMIFAGLTGHVTWDHEPKDVDNLLEALSRSDAR